jgi:coenzyme F420 hydrogenase subunit beta
VKRATSLGEIAAKGLCAGCGLCVGMAPPGSVTLEMSAAGFQRPRVAQALPAALEDKLVALCPGNQLSAPPGDAPHHDPIWGPYYRPMKGHATDAEIRFKASSGGVISAIATYLLASKAVEAIVHVGMDSAAPLQSRLLVSRDRAGVLAGASARYGPAAPLENINDILAAGEPFAFIGKPCDVAGLRNLAKVDPRVDRLMRYALAFFCAGVSSLRISESIVGKYGLTPNDVQLMRYRGHGCPGPTHIEAKDGRVFEQSYDETWSEELNQEIQFRCKICPDGIGEQADIACGDAWVGDSGYAHAEHEGWNALLARTKRGAELLTQMQAAGALYLEPIALADLNAMQPHQVERKQAVLARLAGMAIAGAMLPRYEGQNLLRAAWQGRKRFLGNLLGTRRRIKAGAHREGPVATTE